MSLKRWGILGLIGLAGILDTSFAIPTIAAYAQQLGASEALAGFITGLYSIIALPASIVAGVIVDKIGRKRALNIGLAWDSLSLVGYVISSSPGQLALFRALHALGGSLVYPAYIARITEYGETGRKGLYTGYGLAAVGLAVGLGISLGGLVAGTLGFKTAYMIVSAIIALAAAASLLLEEEPRERRLSIAEIITGLRSSAKPVVLGLLVILIAYIALGLLTGGLAPAILRDGLAASEREASMKAGMVLGAAVFVSVIIMPLLGLAYDSMGLRKSVATALVISLVGLASYPLISLKVYAVISPLAGGIALGGLLLASTLLVAMAPPSSRGSAVALQQVFNILGVAIGAPIGGILSGAYGLSSLVAGVTLLLAISTAIIYIYKEG